MELQKPQVEYIRKSFRKMQSKKDFLTLLNYVKNILYGEKFHPIVLKSLNYHSNPANNNRRYIKFSIKKKSGGSRIIHAPNKGLKVIQRCLNIILQALYDVDEHAFGFVPGRSIADNAHLHIGKAYVYNIDLKDFFTGVDQARIWARLKVKPFQLNGSVGRHELANLIAGLCCQSMIVERKGEDGAWLKEVRNVLPQGAPTSPVLTNIICQQLDYYLGRVALRFGLTYSRYADDITFSSSHFVYQKEGEFINELERQITDHGFYIKYSKTRLQKRGYRQEVTGLVVNSKLNVQRRYIKDLRKWLYYWENYGYKKASVFFESAYSADKGYLGATNPVMAKVIRGKLDFLKMVKGKDDPTFFKLNQRFEILTDIVKEELQNQNTAEPNCVAVPVIDGLPVLHTPLEVVKILKMFSINESALKFATHSWEAGLDDKIFKNYPDFIRKAKKEFNVVSSSLNELNPQLRAKILSFLFNKRVGIKWGMRRVRFGWSSPELKEAMERTPEMMPENMVLPEHAQFRVTSQRGGTQTIQKFKQVIDIFKNEIEIRNDGPVLEELIYDYHFKHLQSFEIMEFTNLNDKNFYTDVDYLHKALDLVFGNIAKYPGNEKLVGYRLIDDPSYYQLAIINYGSRLRGVSIASEKFLLTKGDFGTIKKRLNNLCDWSIETEFAEGSYRLNFLASDPNTASVEPIQYAVGFTYLFTFYK
ncbi:reverse transcriptase domain-containing protein [Mucilaginibacter rubeus]|uniref:reverse transcriptase domain-containing protein n=1 Tax=Mucilaginibacter rubeus TaxID=2027860 RepID=UPI0016692629|nr:reverse transcriptase domain-containing protein [Mucilaginibacter rubeus]GGA95703.1 hypothetical protein GCM10011500_09350 [Mucilaginibacter rubeus]